MHTCKCVCVRASLYGFAQKYWSKSLVKRERMLFRQIGAVVGAVGGGLLGDKAESQESSSPLFMGLPGGCAAPAASCRRMCGSCSFLRVLHLLGGRGVSLVNRLGPPVTRLAMHGRVVEIRRTLPAACHNKGNLWRSRWGFAERDGGSGPELHATPREVLAACM